MLNPSLADLIGGIQAVTLSDAEAGRRGTQKTVLERKSPPTFDVVIELLDYDRLAVHSNVQKTVDNILRGLPPRPEIRVRTGAGAVEVVQTEHTIEVNEPGFNQRFPALARAQKPEEPVGRSSGNRDRPVLGRSATRIPGPIDAVTEEGEGAGAEVPATGLKIFPYGIARTRLERAIRERKAPAMVTADIESADAVMAIRSTYQSRPKKIKELAGKPVRTVVVKSNTFTQIAGALEDLLKGGGSTSGSGGIAVDDRASAEAQAGIETVLQSNKPFELSPQPASVRKQQLQIVETRRLASEAIGQEPNRRVRILPTKLAGTV